MTTILRKRGNPAPQATNKIESPYLTVLEAAQYLRLSKETIYRYLSSGRLPASKLAERWLFKKSDLDALVAGSYDL